MKKRMFSFLLALMLIVSLVPTTVVTANAASNWATTEDAAKILAELEGFRDKPYQSGGNWYIGYGSQITSADLYPNGISKEDALGLLKKHLTDTVDKAINQFTKDRNLDLTRNQHDALALYSYRCGTAWLSNSSNAMYQAVVTGKKGNEFLNAIANTPTPSLASETGLKGEMNRRMSEANMYLYNSYGYNAPSQLTYAILEKDGKEDGVATELIAYDSGVGYELASLPAAGTQNFVGWYVFDGKADGNIEGTPITKLDKNTAGKKIVAKFSEAAGSTAKYNLNTVTLPSRNVYSATYAQADIKNQKPIGELKNNSTFKVTKETVNDKIKWAYGEGVGTDGKTITGWVYVGPYTEPTTPTNKPVATATILADPLNIREGATVGSKLLGTLQKGITVDIYEIKTEKTETGNQKWGRISVTIGGNLYNGWINLSPAYVTLKETSGTTDSAEGKTAKVINAEEVNIRADASTTSTRLTSLKKGTQVTILETKMNGAAQWARVRWSGLKDGYQEGWIYMYYLDVAGAPHTNPGNSTGNVRYTGVVTSNINLNVRKSPDVYAPKVRSLPRGTKVNITDTATSRGMKWGCIGVDEWVCLSYVKLTEVPNSGNSGSGITSTTEIQATVTSTTLDVLKSYNNNSAKVGTLKKGDVVAVLERNTETTGTGTRIWGRIKKDNLEGWINLAYADVKTVTNISGNTGSTGTANGTTNGNANGAEAVIANCLAVNVRDAAGTANKLKLKLNQGTTVKVYEKKTVDNAPWCRITWDNGASEGWVCMYYVEMKATSGTTGGNTTGNTIGNTNSNTISAVGTVNSNIALNVRAGAGLGFAKIGSLNKGAKVTVYEQVSADGMIWGRIQFNKGNGWICMSYINVDNVTSTGKGVMGTIARCFKAVNVRSAPGTNNALVATINVGSRVEVFEKKLYSGQYWGRVAQGWICMDYVLLDSELPPDTKLDETKATTAATDSTKETVNRDNEVLYTINGTVNAVGGLNVRNDASETSLKVGTIDNGLSLKILAVKNNNAELWGRVDQYATAGWVNMSYVTYKVEGYVNTNDQPVYANADTGSTVKGTLTLNYKLIIEKLTVNGSTVYGWVEEGLQGWIPMGRVSDTQQEIPVYSTTKQQSTAGEITGTTNAAIDAVNAVNGSKVLFRLKSGATIYTDELRLEAGYVWGKVTSPDGVEGWIKMNAVTYTIDGTTTTELNVRTTKDTSDEKNVLGTLASGAVVTLCELSFDSMGALWGKVSAAGTVGSALNGGFVKMQYVTLYANILK